MQSPSSPSLQDANSIISLESLDSLVESIRQRRRKVKAMQDACRELSDHCELAYDVARQAISNSVDHQRLSKALGQVSTLFSKMSSSWYIWTTGSTIGNKITTARGEVSEALNTYLDLPPTPNSGLDVQQTTPEQTALQRELAELTRSLKEAERPRGKALKIYERGVVYISPEALARWITNLGMFLEKVDLQTVRFGELFWTFFGDGMVLVKCVSNIPGTTKEDTIQRVKALTHWMRHCEGIMQVQAIQFPDMIVYGSKNAIPLDVYLRQNELDSRDKWVLALKIASALSYVHGCEIIHRDIRAASVFMVEETPGVFEPKLAGFEICRSEASVSIGPRDDDVWHSPERRHGSSKETDVYAFGVLMYEIAMGGPPPCTVHTTPPGMAPRQNVDIWVAMSTPAFSSPRYVKLMRRCLAEDFLSRPSMADVFTELSDGY
ncbi:hypothetical protein DFQ26_005876 [Actinomortierella ambigua]|nr:hypothetical protein DFQ26_005876 [Actinomortierella ambigua]